MSKFLFFIVSLFSISLFAQQNVFIDFGNTGTSTPGNWNNVIVSSQNETGIMLNLVNDVGVSTGIAFELTDSFDHINTNGTSSPNSALPFPSTATRDSFFGETSAGFNGNINDSGGFTLSGLDPAKYYSFSVFSSRTNVTDNRETLYTVVGNSTDTAALNVANNTTSTADILNIQADANGQIVFTASPGPNNNNSFGFFYLGTLQLIISDNPITDITPSPELSLTYPNGGHIWEVGKTVRVKWSSISVPSVLIEFSSNIGTTWSTIASANGVDQYYDMVVPNEISTQCLIRVSGSGFEDTSDAVFETIADTGENYKIVVLGSSTAAGTGPGDVNDAWVWLYRTYLTEMDTRYEVVNLAQGGFATYNILPTGSAIPAGVNRTIDTSRNITYALSLNPDGIIINLPSNDAASGYPEADQIANYNLIKNAADSYPVRLWVTTPQPRNFGSNTTNLSIQLDMIQATYDLFGNNTIDFWTGFPISGDNGILPAYDSGDGVHMNAAAHYILFQRVLGMNIHNIIRNPLGVEDVNSDGQSILYPNPIEDKCTIKLPNHFNGSTYLSIYDIQGKLIETIHYSLQQPEITWYRKNYPDGIYILKVKNQNNLINKQIILK